MRRYGGKIDLRRTILLGVDAQNAFGKRAQSAKLRGLRDSEDEEVRNLARLVDAVHESGGAVVLTKDWHNEVGAELPGGRIDLRSRAEFAIYGRHAVAGTTDAELSLELEAAVQRAEARGGLARTIIPVDAYDTTGREGARRLVEVHKNVFDVTQVQTLDGNMAANAALIGLLAGYVEAGARHVLVAGKIAEVCVRAGAQSVKKLFPMLDVIVVPGATSSLPGETAKQLGLDSKEETLEKLAAQGIGATDLSDLLPTAPNRSPPRMGDRTRDRIRR